MCITVALMAGGADAQSGDIPPQVKKRPLEFARIIKQKDAGKTFEFSVGDYFAVDLKSNFTIREIWSRKSNLEFLRPVGSEISPSSSLNNPEKLEFRYRFKVIAVGDGELVFEKTSGERFPVQTGAFAVTISASGTADADVKE